MMKTAALVMFFTVLLAFNQGFSSSMAAPTVPSIYKVGEDEGWTAMGNVDYTLWAASKTFYVGDVLRFEYSSTYHNVMQVPQKDYESCSRMSPIATYNTGDDYITLNSGGDYYFICGAPHHCESGQKVHVNVLPRTVASSSPSPSLSPSPSPAGSRGSSRSPTPISGSPGATPTSGSSRSSPMPITGASLVAMSFAMVLVAIFAGYV